MSPIERHLNYMAELDKERAENDPINADSRAGLPDWELVASWKYEYFPDMPEDIDYEDVARILQNSAHGLLRVLDELNELPLSRNEKAAMYNLIEQAQLVRMKAHVSQLMVKSIRDREKRISEDGD